MEQHGDKLGEQARLTLCLLYSTQAGSVAGNTLRERRSPGSGYGPQQRAKPSNDGRRKDWSTSDFPTVAAAATASAAANHREFVVDVDATTGKNVGIGPSPALQHLLDSFGGHGGESRNRDDPRALFNSLIAPPGVVDDAGLARQPTPPKSERQPNAAEPPSIGSPSTRPPPPPPPQSTTSSTGALFQLRRRRLLEAPTGSQVFGVIAAASTRVSPV